MKELERENAKLKRLVAELSLENQKPEGRGLGKLLSPERRRCAVEHAREQYEVSERHASRLLGQWRRTQGYAAIQRIDEAALTEAITLLVAEYTALTSSKLALRNNENGDGVGKGFRFHNNWI